MENMNLGQANSYRCSPEDLTFVEKALSALADGAELSVPETMLLLRGAYSQIRHNVVAFPNGISEFDEAVREFISGEPLERVVWQHSVPVHTQTPQDSELGDRIQSTLDLVGQETSSIDGYGIKPSRNIGSIEVNSRYRTPNEKALNHRDPNGVIGKGYNATLVDGTYMTTLSRSEAVQFKPNEPQYRKLLKLLRALENRGPSKNRHGKLLELYGDLAQYVTSLFPNRTLHTTLMAQLQSAINQNAVVQVTLINYAGHEKFETGYKIHKLS